MERLVTDILIGFLTGVLVSGVVFYYFYSKLLSKKESLQKRALELYYENSYLHEKESLKEEFKEIADKTLHSTTNSLLKTSQSSISYILQPFKEDIQNFKNEIKNYYHDESKERFVLKKELQILSELNYKLSEESSRLTNALKHDNKFAGNWGEFVLSSLLELSGLRDGYEFDTQVDFKVQNTHFRPDVIVHLPKNRDVIIDSKVSLKAYERYVNGDKDIKEHINSIKAHINSLSKKSYHKLIDTVDMVLLFIPIEGAFVEAMRGDRELFEYAYKKNILLVTPTNLITVLKTIEYSWKKHNQDENTKAIVKKASSLYDKFESFLKDMEQVDNSLLKARDAYDSAYKKLSSGNANLLKQSRELKEMI